MTRQITLRSAGSGVGRRQPLLDGADYSSRGGIRRMSVGEMAGGTAAECAAVCCCCPCGIVDLLVLAVYKVPAGLCRKAIRRKRHRRLMKKGGLPPRRCTSCDEEFFELHSVPSHLSFIDLESLPENTEVIELEKEMWDKFYGAGFWRSPSQRSDISGLPISAQ